MRNKVGIGYDSHRLIKGRKLILGGVHIPFESGLDGHSDADALLHALCDAILGALGKGDIGEHFPDTDDQYKDIASLTLMEQVNGLVKEAGYTVGNVDTVIMAEAPSLKEYKGKMKETISSALKINPEDVNVKATSNEKMGFVGRQEGIAAWAVVLLVSL